MFGPPGRPLFNLPGAAADYALGSAFAVDGYGGAAQLLSLGGNYAIMKIALFFAIAVFLSMMSGYSARAQGAITNFDVPVADTPTNLARQISSADHVVVIYTFVNPPTLTNVSLSISGDRLTKIVGAVSSARQHFGTITSWGWKMQFYRGTNCLAKVPFSGDFFVVAGHGGCEYIDESGALKKLYLDALDKAHFDK